MSEQQKIDTFLSQPGELQRLNQWIFENIHPYIKGRTLEIGSGQTTFSSLLISHGLSLHLSDADSITRYKLRERFKENPIVKAVHHIDLHHIDFDQAYSSMAGVFSTILALNITENAFSLKKIVENVKMLLRKGGHLIIAIPSYTELFPGAEPDLKELKQLDQKPLLQLLGECQILKTRYFNIQRNGDILILNRTSISLVAVARKNK